MTNMTYDREIQARCNSEGPVLYRREEYAQGIVRDEVLKYQLVFTAVNHLVMIERVSFESFWFCGFCGGFFVWLVFWGGCLGFFKKIQKWTKAVLRGTQNK